MYLKMTAFNITDKMFSVKDKHIIITGAGGVIGSTISISLAEAGASLSILDLSEEKLKKTEERIKVFASNHLALKCDVMDVEELQEVKKLMLKKHDRIDALINVAGGVIKNSTTKTEFVSSSTPMEDSFFGINLSDFQATNNLNFIGSVLPIKVFGEEMVKHQGGNIINISSMGAIRPLTKSPAYCAGKAAITNFTQWLAVHLSKSNIRVNAIAPGFLLTEQNRFLLLDENTGELTQRGRRIIDHTPLGKLGYPQQLVSTVFWLLSDSSSFITGAIIPVDGGFSAYSGV